MKTTWWNRLKSGLNKSSTQVGGKLRTLFFHRKVNIQTLDELEEILIQSDMGVSVAMEFKDKLSKIKLDPKTASEQIMTELQGLITEKLEPVSKPITLQSHQLNVIMMVGVNGSGKTTTLAKLAKQWSDQGLKVEVAACDTFRAAANEQLLVWANRVGVHVHQGQIGHDPSGLAWQALSSAQSNHVDVLIIDTAGRLQNKEHLMQELLKMDRVIKKVIPSAPHHTILVLDATTGQNSLSQLEAFKAVSNVTGLIVTKLDGTAKGGVVIALADRFHLPIHAIGVGEGVQDLQPFTATEFTQALLGIETDDTH